MVPPDPLDEDAVDDGPVDAGWDPPEVDPDVVTGWVIWPP